MWAYNNPTPLRSFFFSLGIPIPPPPNANPFLAMKSEADLHVSIN